MGRKTKSRKTPEPEALLWADDPLIRLELDEEDPPAGKEYEAIRDAYYERRQELQQDAPGSLREKAASLLEALLKPGQSDL